MRSGLAAVRGLLRASAGGGRQGYPKVVPGSAGGRASSSLCLAWAGLGWRPGARAVVVVQVVGDWALRGGDAATARVQVLYGGSTYSGQRQGLLQLAPRGQGSEEGGPSGRVGMESPAWQGGTVLCRPPPVFVHGTRPRPATRALTTLNSADGDAGPVEQVTWNRYLPTYCAVLGPLRTRSRRHPIIGHTAAQLRAQTSERHAADTREPQMEQAKRGVPIGLRTKLLRTLRNMALRASSALWVMASAPVLVHARHSEAPPLGLKAKTGCPGTWGLEFLRALQGMQAPYISRGARLARLFHVLTAVILLSKVHGRLGRSAEASCLGRRTALLGTAADQAPHAHCTTNQRQSDSKQLAGDGAR